MKRLKEYFLGEFIKDKDILERSRHAITFNISFIAAVLTLSLTIFTLFNESYLVSLRAFMSVVIMVSVWFYSKKVKSTLPLARLLVYASGFTIFSNIFYVFQEIDFSVICLFLATLVFSFIILKRNEAVLYTSIFSLFILTFTFLSLSGIEWTSVQPQELKLHEQIVATLIGVFLMGYVMWQFDLTFLAFVEYTENQRVKLREAKENAEEMNRLKSNFLANMSHEIRTPINGIMGLSEIISCETQDPEIKEMADMQKKSSVRLMNTINSILNLSKLEAESPSFKLSKVHLSGVIENSTNLLMPIASKKNVQLRNNCNLSGVTVLASEEILFQVFNNIIGNAIKFTEKGHVTINCKVLSDNVCIDVEDTGIGISKEFLPRIFNSFEQESQGISRSFEGTGLGLSITKKYLELIGGDIKIESTKGVGSIFTIILPYKAN